MVGQASVVSVGRFGLEALPHEVKVETVATRGGENNSALAVQYFL